ncbi:MAG: NAD(P)H-dependent oxidoreductase, partial [Actinomycetota bacterium]|nr:NAD(P)H-dependent oxidoreductase [Actinomycetota bacterium]
MNARASTVAAAIPHILALCGSLQARSSNDALLRLAAERAPASTTVERFGSLATVAHFNPDHDGDDPPTGVAALRRALAGAAGVLIASP